jgi:muramoyltetrapeptide carboxypeptidase
LLSPMLRVGDRVQLLSPASWPDPEWLQASIDILESWGLLVDVGAHALDRWGYMAGRDEDRLADLNNAFRDPGVRAIITTRGGAGAYRIADSIDFDAVRADPKPVVGFSDITYLHLALWHHCRLAAIHGALAGPTAAATVHQLLMSTQPVTLKRDPQALSAAVGVSGVATGPLVGGNLTAVAGSVEASRGSFDGSILFLEGPRTIGLGQVDRALTLLLRSGALDGVRGVALGLFDGFDDYTDRGWNLIDVLADRLAVLNVPVLGGLFAGHGGIGLDGGPDQSALPLGAVARLDADAGTLTVEPCVC